MEFLSSLFKMIADGMKQEITVFGFTFSFWSVMFFTAIAELVVQALRRIFDD